MKYLSIKENGFGFKHSEINEILETDVKIKDEIYNRFFEEQSKGKQFKIKSLEGKTFEEIFEEVIPEPQEPGVIEPSPIELLKKENAELKQSIAELSAIVTGMMAP